MLSTRFLLLTAACAVASGQDIDTTGCGTTLGCYRVPAGCSTNCDYLFTWRKQGNNEVDFAIQGTLNGNQDYIAVGFSLDGAMGHDSVIDCIHNANSANSIIVQMSYNQGTANIELNGSPGFIASSASGSFNNGRLTCRVTRTLASASNNRVFALNADYNIMVAKGSYSSGRKLEHDHFLVTTSSKVNPAAGNNEDVAGTGSPLVAVHGILMVLAWMVSASAAMLLPRYFKDAWPGKKLCGKPIWFNLHLSLTLIALFLTVFGFIIIFVEAGGYSKVTDLPDSAHPPLGIITTLLVIANPIMAAFRCDPGTQKRVIFNWAHFAVGLLSHIMAVVTIAIGVVMTKSNLPGWALAIVIVYIIWHILIEVGLAVHKHCGTPKNKVGSKVQLDGVDDKKEVEAAGPSEDQKRKSSIIRSILLGLHFLGVLALSVVLIIAMAIA